jgi:hypothetical protein
MIFMTFGRFSLTFHYFSWFAWIFQWFSLTFHSHDFLLQKEYPLEKNLSSFSGSKIEDSFRNRCKSTVKLPNLNLLDFVNLPSTAFCGLHKVVGFIIDVGNVRECYVNRGFVLTRERKSGGLLFWYLQRFYWIFRIFTFKNIKNPLNIIIFLFKT